MKARTWERKMTAPSDQQLGFAQRYYTKPDMAQTITFNPGNKTYGDPPFALSASASAGLPVSFTVVSFPVPR